MQYCTVVSQEVHHVHTFADLHIGVSESSLHYSTSMACIRIESTDGNFGTHEKVAIPIPIVTCTLPIPIPIFGIFVFPFPWDSHGNPIPMHI